MFRPESSAPVLILLAMSLTFAKSALAAPCCSAGSALPALVTNDDLAQLTLSHSYGNTVMDAPARGAPVLRSDANEDTAQLTRLSGAWKFSEFWQIGAGTSILSRETRVSHREHQKTGLADSDLSLGYEILPEWNYSLLRPRGFLYLQLVLPTGKSVQDPRVLNPADVRGQGVYQSVLGGALTKNWEQIDAYIVPEVRRLYGRRFSGSNNLRGTWGSALQVGAGYSPRGTAMRFGLRTQPTYQGLRAIETDGRSTTVPEKMVWNTGADASYLIRDRWLASLSYSDQTLLGPVRNTTLERAVAFSIQHRWEP